MLRSLDRARAAGAAGRRARGAALVAGLGGQIGVVADGLSCHRDRVGLGRLGGGSSRIACRRLSRHDGFDGLGELSGAGRAAQRRLDRHDGRGARVGL